MSCFQTFSAQESGINGNIILTFSSKSEVKPLRNIGYFRTFGDHESGKGFHFKNKIVWAQSRGKHSFQSSKRSSSVSNWQQRDKCRGATL